MKANFTLLKPQEIILGFRESEDKIKEVCVNGKDTEYTFLNEYIILPKGLEVLQEVQRTGDIFFPKNWANALLRNHRSKEAYLEVKAFFEAHSEYPPLLKNKILQAAWPLYREAGSDRISSKAFPQSEAL